MINIKCFNLNDIVFLIRVIQCLYNNPLNMIDKIKINSTIMKSEQCNVFKIEPYIKLYSN